MEFVDLAVLDSVTFEVARSRFIAASNEMALVVAKSAYSTPVNEGRDFSGTIYDRDGRLVSQGEFDLPAFAGITQCTVPEVIRQIGRENVEAGDVYMINDPYVASTHCNDVHLVKPVFIGDELLAYVASTAHWSDVGGLSPGSLNCRARSHFEEGMRIPAVKVARRGTRHDDILRLLFANMREPWERMGDFNAQVSAIETGSQRLMAMVESMGLDTVLAAMAQVQDHSERLIRASLSDLPDGVYSASDMVDMDVATGEAKAIRCTLTIAGDSAVFDLTATDDMALSGVNCTIAATTSAFFIGLASILPKMPMNAGVMRAIEIVVRRSSMCWAEPPAPVSGQGATSMESVIGAVMQCLSQAVPERAVGVGYSILNCVYSGTDARPTFGQPYINYAWGFGGLGATLGHDGANVVGSAYSASTQNIPCELQERRYPVVYRRYRMLADSGGPGRTRGGLGLDQVLEFPYAPGVLSCIGNRERFGPPGFDKGLAGGRARLVVNPGMPSQRNVGIFATNEAVQPGEPVSFWSAGGGGYSEPAGRLVSDVIEDVADGYVSVEGAARDYGVVLAITDERRMVVEVDIDATEELRDAMRKGRA